MNNIENIDNPESKVLVTGATGMQGGAAIRALLREGYPVTAFVRDPSSDSAQALAEQGVNLATGDLNDLASLEAASIGHDAVFSVQLSGAHPDNPGAELRQAHNVVTAAKQAGVKQIVHTSVSSTGWRDKHPEFKLGELITTYWDEKEAAEAEVRNSGVDRWTIIKPAFYMDNFLPIKKDEMYPELPAGKLVVSMSSETKLAMTNSTDFGEAVLAVVSNPDKFHEAEIEFAGDALTFNEIASAMSKAANRLIVAEFVSYDERERLLGTPTADSELWTERVGYPARPEDAARYGLTTTTFEEWASKQDWTLPRA